MALQYLTVQDMLWINLQLTHKVQHFGYARLEEATFYQYAYGESSDLLSQAARFITGFAKLNPFDAGNEATGFVGAVAFLKLNGRELTVSDAEAAAWFKSLSQTDAAPALEQATKAGEAHHLTIRQAIQSVLDAYRKTLASLTPLSV